MTRENLSEALGDQSAKTAEPELQRRVAERFGVLSNFFRLSPETPEITERLWGFAQAAYLDDPDPSVFEERLFVYLSRFCAAHYCIARHLAGQLATGIPAPKKVEDVVKLLQQPFPRGPESGQTSVSAEYLEAIATRD